MRELRGILLGLMAVAAEGARAGRYPLLAPRMANSNDPSNAPICDDPDAKPFCSPKNNSDLYIGKIKNVIWRTSFFDPNSTIRVLLQDRNDSTTQVWRSDPTKNEIGYVPIKVDDGWLNSFDAYNYSFVAQYWNEDDVGTKWVGGPDVTVKHEPPRHYPGPAPTPAPNNDGLMIGLPVSLGVVAFVVAGLYFVNRKNRKIGLGNVMGRNRGYDGRKSRRQRMGLTKKNGAIRLDERQDEIAAENGAPAYHDVPRRPARPDADEESLGSLVNEDGPRQQSNVFRDEIQRQQTGRE